MAEDRPLGAFALSLAAGVLFLLEGFVFSLASSLASALGSPAAGDLLGALGFASVVTGLIVVLLAVALYRSPEAHMAVGIVIVILSLGSFLFGGGFYLGAILGVIGGYLAIRFEYEPEPIPDIYQSRGTSGGEDPFPEIVRAPQNDWATDADSGAARRASARVCDNCASSIPVGARRCPNCETPVPEFRPLRPPPRPPPPSGAPGSPP